MEAEFSRVFVIFYLSVLGYVLGSFNGAQFLHHYIPGYRRTHPTRIGTKNAGTQNVWMMIGRLPALLVFCIDAGKGFLIIWITKSFFGFSGSWILVPGLFAIIGHNWPIFFHFRGGRGVATLAGIISAYNLSLTLFIIPFVVPFILFRIAGLTPFIVLILLAFYEYPSRGKEILIVTGIFTAFIILRRLHAEWGTLKTTKHKIWTLKNILIYDRSGANPPSLGEMFDFFS